MRLRCSTRVLSRLVSGGRFRSTRFRTRWTNLPHHRSGASVARTTAPNPAKRMNPTAPRMAALTNPRLVVGPPTRITGSANSGRARRPPTPRREKAARPPTVVPVSCPLTANIRNCTAAPTAAPPGMIKLTALLASWDVTTGNQALVLKGQALQPERAGEVTDLEEDGQGEPDGLESGQPWPRCQHLGDRWEDQVDGDAGDTHHDAVLDDLLPGQRMAFLIIDPVRQTRACSEAPVRRSRHSRRVLAGGGPEGHAQACAHRQHKPPPGAE